MRLRLTAQFFGLAFVLAGVPAALAAEPSSDQFKTEIEGFLDKLAATTNGLLTITSAVLTVTADNQTRSYGAANPTFTFTYTGFVNGDDAGVLSGSPSLSTTADPSSSVAGSPYSITVSRGTLGAGNYSFAFVGGTLTVTQAVLTVTAQSTNRVYGAANPAFTASYSGFVNDEDAGVLTGSPDLSTLAVANSPVAGSPYPITAQQGSLANGNYSFVFIDGALTVTPATLTVIADSLSRTYGAANPPLTAQYSGFVAGDDQAVLSGQPDLSTAATANSPVAGSPYLITVQQGTLAAANYTFAFTDGALTVTPATLLVVADNLSRAYGAANPPLTAHYSGFVAGDNQSVLSGQPDLSTTAVTNSPVGSYPILVTAGSLSAANYSFSFVNGTLTVGRSILTVTADDASRVYGATNPLFTVTYSGFQNGDDTNVLSGAPDFSTTAETNSSVAGSPYLITVTNGTLSASNYDLVFVAGQLTITPAALTGSITANDKTYDGTTAATIASRSLSGVIGSDDVTLSGGTAMFDNRNAGVAKLVTATGLSLSGAQAGNYTVNDTATATAEVSARPITVSAVSDSKIYDGTTASAVVPAITSGSLGAGDTAGFIQSFNTKDVTADTLTPSGVVSDGNNGNNYTVTFNSTHTASIQPAPLTPSITASNKVYDGTVSAVIATRFLSGVISGDDVTLTGGTASFSDPGVGTAKTVTATGFTLTGATAFDYVLSSTTATTAADITKAALAMAVTSSANPALPGASVTFTATLSAVAPGAGLPSGSVQFRADSLALDSPAALSAGAASLTNSSLAHGTHTITAEYPGDGNFTGITNHLSPNQVINTPPVANLATYTRSPGLSLKIRLSDLLTNFTSDADNDNRTLVSIGAGTNEARVVISGSFIFYSPPSSSYSNSDDHVDYIISDGFTGGTATNKIHVAVLYPSGQSANISSISVVAGGIQITFFGIPGYTYHVQRAPTPEGPWNELGTATINSLGQGTFTDTDPPQDQAYYRTSWP